MCHCCQNLIPRLRRRQGTRISVPQQTHLSSSGQPRRYGELHPVECNATASYAISTRWHKNGALAGRAHKIKRISPNIFPSINTFVSNESDKAATHNGVSTSSPHTEEPTEGRANIQKLQQKPQRLRSAEAYSCLSYKLSYRTYRLTSTVYSVSNRFESQVEDGHLGLLTLPYPQANARSTTVKLIATASAHVPLRPQLHKLYPTLFEVSVHTVPHNTKHQNINYSYR